MFGERSAEAQDFFHDAQEGVWEVYERGCLAGVNLDLEMATKGTVQHVYEVGSFPARTFPF